jgi:hypothetical protein
LRVGDGDNNLIEKMVREELKNHQKSIVSHRSFLRGCSFVTNASGRRQQRGENRSVRRDITDRAFAQNTTI